MVRFKLFWHSASAMLMLLLFNSISTLVIAINNNITNISNSNSNNNFTNINNNNNNNNNNIRVQNKYDNCPKGCHCTAAYVSCLLVSLRTVPRLPADTAQIRSSADHDDDVKKKVEFEFALTKVHKIMAYNLHYSAA